MDSMPRLTGAQMKYLHVIYRARKSGMNIRSVDVARELGLTKASVCRMIKFLSNMGLICVSPYGMIDTTEAGKGEGSAIHQRFSRIRPFFAEHLELDDPEATDSAYLFLSSFSADCIDRFLQKGWAAEKSARAEPPKPVTG